MPLRPALLAEIQAALGATITPSLTVTDDPWDIYEAYVLTLVLRAAEAEGAIIEYSDTQGNWPTIFVFRTSPGHIYSTLHPYCHAVLRFPGKPPLEAHMSVRVSGKSKVLHECDVCVLHQEEAATCRNAPPPKPDPRSSKMLLAIECKFYGTSLGIGLARAFVGLVADLSDCHAYLVYNTSSPVVETFLTERRRNWEHYVVPSNMREVERLRNQIQTVFRKYMAGI